MKRIEELIRIIYHRATILNGTPYENDDPLCKAEAEILSRFAELKKEEEKQRLKKEYYHEEHAKELIKRVELEKENEMLKVCRNHWKTSYETLKRERGTKNEKYSEPTV